MRGMVRRNFRITVSRDHVQTVEALLLAEGFRFESEPFAWFARVLTQEPKPLGTSAAARLGLIYIQDRSSMLPPLALEPPPGACVLDMCAAPGSKTGLLARMVGSQGTVLACEPSGGRINSLRANLRRAGAVNTASLHISSEKLALAGPGMSHILLDPPCSGWGTEDKNPQARALWSGEKVKPLIRLQRALLERAARLLRPGGRLVYSTCTTNEDENEAQVLFALEHLGLRVSPLAAPAGFVLDAPRLDCPQGVLRVAEDSEGEGFFVAALERPGSDDLDCGTEPAVLPDGARRVRVERLHCDAPVAWGQLPRGELVEYAGLLVLLPDPALQRIRSGTRWQGATVGRLKKQVFRPDPFCRLLLPESVADGLHVSDPADILALLSGQSLTVSRGKGPVPLYLNGLGLGWAARKGNRVLWTEL